jgi:hypothetical protein
VKRNQTSTLKAKYEEMFDDEMGAVFAFLPIVLWEKIVFETHKQAVLIPQVRPAHKYPNSPWEMIHPPGGDNAVCM